MLERVVIVLAIIFDGDRFAQVAKFNHDLGVVIVDFNWRYIFDYGLDFLEHVGYQNRVIGRQKAARLLDDGGMRNVFIVAYLFDGIDDVVGKFLRIVIGGRIKRRLRTVIVDRHAATYVKQFNRDLHLFDFRIDARGFLHRVLDPFDVSQLRADMKMEQAQHVDAIGFFQTIDYFQQLSGSQTKLGCFAARLFPTARTL